MVRVALVCAAALLVGSPGAAADTPAEVLRRAEALAAADRPADAEPLYLEAIHRGEPFTRRRAYFRLMAAYIKSGRADKAVRLADPFRTWLRDVRDRAAEAELDAILGECFLGLGHYEAADRHFAAALAPNRDGSADVRLGALRGRAEVADQKRDAAGAKQRWADLEEAARDAVALAEKATDAPFHIKAAQYLALALYRRGDTKAALATLAPLPDLHDRIKDPVGRRDTQRQRANLLAASDHFADAVPLFREALALHREHRGTRRIPAGDILAEWMAAARAANQRDEAARLRLAAEAEYKAVLDAPAATDLEDGGPLVAFVKLQLLTRSGRQFRKALDLSRTAGERWSADALLEVRLKADRGELELLAASYQTARTLLAKVLAELDAADPPDLRALPQVLVNLATAELAGDTPEKADALLARCAELYRRHKLPPDGTRAECDYLFGAAAAQRGDYAQAVRHFRAGLDVCDAVGPKAEPVRFNLLLNTALIYKDQGDFTGGLDYLTAAAASLATFAEPDDLSFGLIDAARADLFVAQARVDAAVAVIGRVEAVCDKYGVRGGYLWGTARHVRALDLLARKEPAKAEAVWADLADLQRKEGQLLLGRTLNFLGLAAELQGHDAEAARHYAAARQFHAARPWAPATTRAITLWRLAVLADKGGRKAEAKKLLGEVFDVADRARLTTFGEAGQRAQFFAQFRPAFELLAGWHARDGEGEALAAVITRSRSRTLLDQILAAGVDPREALTGSDRDRLLPREAEVRTRVSRLRAKAQLLPVDKPDDPAVKKLLAELDAAQKEFADVWREIAAADPVTRALTDSDRGEGVVARKVLGGLGGKPAALLYMVGRHDSYAVLYPDPTSRAEVFRLTVPKALAAGIGDAPPAVTATINGLRGITVRPAYPQPDRPAPLAGAAVPFTEAVAGRLVDHYLRQVADPQFTATRGIAVVSKVPGATTATPSESLGDAVLPPALRARLKATGADRLVVVPDGALHRIPLECLLVSAGGAGRFALDELPPVAYAPSLGVLAVVATRAPNVDGPASLLTVADPTYAAGEPTLAVGGKRDGPAASGALARLPFTAVESKRVREFFPADRVTTLEGTTATERRVTAALPGKRFVHLATHGFADDRFGNLFAAVAFTPPPPGQETPDDDGFLSLHEIYRLKLTGCELTVLSACVTNVGPQRPLEAGVTLAGAFLCAGSRRVVATCWSVEDRATAELVAEFFRGVAAGGEKRVSSAAALKAARMKVRATPGWEAPFYWAGFVYLGLPD
jgi:CHAT domain-containing protein/tetratricopeptide (TPR) repeat protein